MNNRDITLVELLIVIVIVGIIGSIGTIFANNIIENTRINADEANVVTLNQATRLYTVRVANNVVFTQESDADFLIDYLYQEKFIAQPIKPLSKDGFFTYDSRIKLWLYKGQYIIDTSVSQFKSDGRGNFIDKPYTGTSQSITIPDKIDGTIVELILSDAFNANNELQTVKLTSVNFTSASELKRIHARAFANNELTSLHLPDSIERIDLRAFINNKISYLKLPPNLVEIEQNVFNDNPLTSIRVGPNLDINKVGKNALGPYTSSFLEAYEMNHASYYQLQGDSWIYVGD